VKSKHSITPSQSPPHEGEKRRGGFPPDEGEKGKGKTFNKSALVAIAFELGFIIALPIIAFGTLGKWLDARAGTEPLLTLVGVLAAIVSTSVWIYRKFKNYFK
jgi:hypothetical protein